MNKIITQFIPIIVIFLLLSYSKEFIEFSDTILGKLFAVVVVMYYTILDVKIGLLVCSLVVYYYQSDVVENMLNIDSLFEKDSSEDEEEGEDNVEGMENMSCAMKKKTENMSSLDEIYGKELYVEKSLEGVKKFRKDNCDGNALKYKNMNVKNEVVEHVFPEVVYKQEKCNPCADTCDISIKDSKLKTEKDIIPKFSKDEKIL